MGVLQFEYLLPKDWSRYFHGTQYVFNQIGYNYACQISYHHRKMRDDHHDMTGNTSHCPQPLPPPITKTKEKQVAKRSEHDKTIVLQLLYLVNYQGKQLLQLTIKYSYVWHLQDPQKKCNISKYILLHRFLKLKSKTNTPPFLFALFYIIYNILFRIQILNVLIYKVPIFIPLKS